MLLSAKLQPLPLKYCSAPDLFFGNTCKIAIISSTAAYN